MQSSTRMGVMLTACMVAAIPRSDAAVWCELTDYVVDSHEHTGVYLSGTLAGQNVAWIVICGVSGTQQDCNSKATDRRLALALAAQAQGKRLLLYFESLGTCSAYVPYTTATIVRVEP